MLKSISTVEAVIILLLLSFSTWSTVGHETTQPASDVDQTKESNMPLDGPIDPVNHGGSDSPQGPEDTASKPAEPVPVPSEKMKISESVDHPSSETTQTSEQIRAVSDLKLEEEQSKPGIKVSDTDRHVVVDKVTTQQQVNDDLQTDDLSADSQKPITPDTETPSVDVDAHVTSDRSADVPCTSDIPLAVASNADAVSQQAPANLIKVEEEIAAPNNGVDMPSFDEWKLKEQEKNKNTDEVVPPTSSQIRVKSSKTNVNHASVTCGAKILASNPEAQHAAFLLIENKDQYMINPCKAKKWFIVELCEPVQVQLIELGNLELFSSLPKTFMVYISDRYPTKDWKALGTFHAHDRRAVQSFPVSDGLMFVKYIRVEMLTHYADEHYCPLSNLRVYGLTADDDDVEERETHELSEDCEVNSVAEKSKNLFTSATDTVLSLVKTVLNTKSESDESMESIGEGRQQTDVPCEADVARPCVPNVSVPARSQSTDNNYNRSVVLPATPDPNSLQNISTNQGDAVTIQNGPVVPPGVISETPADRKNIVTLIETPTTSLPDLFDSCYGCPVDMNQTWQTHLICDYFSTVYSRTSCCATAAPPLELPPPRQSLVVLVSSGTDVEPSTVQVPHSRPVPESSVQPSPVLPSSRTVLASSQTASVPSVLESSLSFETSSTMHRATQTLANLPSTTSGQSSVHSTFYQAATCTRTSPFDAFLYTSCGHPSRTQRFSSSTSSSRPQYTSSSPVLMQSSQDNILSVPSVGSRPLDTRPGSPLPQDGLSAGSSGRVADPEPTDNTTSNQLTDEKTIYADVSNVNNNDDVMQAIELDDITYAKLRGKESNVVKLKNRIKALELNLSLTNRYLEELSQRYKRQMEDMYNSLNKTIAKLIITSKTAQEQDQKQIDRIAAMEHLVQQLTTAVAKSKDRVESMKTELSGSQMWFVKIQSAVCIALLLFCVSRQQNKTSCCNNVTQNSRASVLTRQKSVSTVPSSTHLSPHRSGSESDLTAIEHNIPFLLKQSSAVNFDHPKKKKKKLGQCKSGGTSSSTTVQELTSSSFSPTAGVIFKAGSSLIKPEAKRSLDSKFSQSTTLSSAPLVPEPRPSRTLQYLNENPRTGHSNSKPHCNGVGI